MIKRLKDKEVKGLEGVFYIVEIKTHNTPIWQLRLRDSHFVMSAVGSKEKVLECLRTICFRYKTYDRLKKVLRDCEFKTNKLTIQRYQIEYNNSAKFFNEEVEEIVRECMKSVVKKSPVKKTIKMTEGVLEEKDVLAIKEKPVVIRPLRKKSRIGKLSI